MNARVNDAIRHQLNPKFGAIPLAQHRSGLLIPAHAAGKWHMDIFDPDGNKIYEDDWENLVTTQGKNSLLNVGLHATTQITTWYLGLISATPTAAAGDTHASHAGWTEITAYSESVRQTFVENAAASGSIDNVGSVATFTINADGTSIGGALLSSVSTKNSTSGSDILYAVGAFSGGNVTLNNGSTIQLTATFSV